MLNTIPATVKNTWNASEADEFPRLEHFASSCDGTLLGSGYSHIGPARFDLPQIGRANFRLFVVEVQGEGCCGCRC